MSSKATIKVTVNTEDLNTVMRFLQFSAEMTKGDLTVEMYGDCIDHSVLDFMSEYDIDFQGNA